MALARARAFQQKQQEESAAKKIETLFQITVIKGGDAVNFPKIGDSCAVNYAAYLEDGTCFDNSFKRGAPINFILGSKQLIEAFEMVVPLMSKGEKARIVVPPEYGYGDRGYPPIIPPKATLLYEIELLTFTSVGSIEKLLRDKRENDPFALVN